MGYQVLDPTDLVLSADSTVTPLWSGYKTTLTTFATSSTQAASSQGAFYLTVYNTSSVAEQEIQFHIAYVNKTGLSGKNYNILVPNVSSTRTLYGQYRSLLLGDENANFVFGNYSADDFYVINIERSRYKEKLLPSSFELTLDSLPLWNGDTNVGAKITLIASISSSTPTFTDAGRVYQIVSGSLTEGIYTEYNSFGYTTNKGSYGLLYPDVGIILLNCEALKELPSSGENYYGGISLPITRTSNTNVSSTRTRLFGVINDGASFKLQSEETLSSNYVFVRARNGDFNYSSNPSFISGSTGELVNEILINQPITYITTVGLYNDNNDLLAVAKLSRPLQKDFTKELLVRVKLDF